MPSPKSNEKSASSSFGFKRGFLNNNNAASAIQTTRASSNDYDTPAEATTTAAATTTATTEARAAPSTEDPQDENECVLCCYPFPIKEHESRYQSCCGEVICRGCIIAQQRTEFIQRRVVAIGTNVEKPIKGSKAEEKEFMMILCSEQNMVCPFCRAKAPTNDKECLKRIWKRIDEYKDPEAMIMLGSWYENGKHGLSKNLKKAEELYQQAYDLGDPNAAYGLAELYTEHIPDQQARKMKYLEEGARRGNTLCNICLGAHAYQFDNYEEAKRQLMMAARSGHKEAMSNLMLIYRTTGSVVSKDDLATTLRAHKAANDTRKTVPREYAIRFKAFEEKMISTGQLKVVGDKDKRK